MTIVCLLIGVFCEALKDEEAHPGKEVLWKAESLYFWKGGWLMHVVCRKEGRKGVCVCMRVLYAVLPLCIGGRGRTLPLKVYFFQNTIFEVDAER